jgi:tricorn protease-like protein
MIKSKFSFLLFALFADIILSAAQMPETDIWIFNIVKDTASSKVKFTAPRRINTGNRYNNQPSFTPDSKHVLFSSSTDSLQTDIYLYSLLDSTIQRITETPESEFSPVMYEKGKISVVRMDSDKGQRLYSIDMEDDNQATLLVNFNDSVAYYGWIGPKDVALSVLNNKKMELQIFNLPSQQYISLMPEKSGRCFGSIAPGEICYMQKITDTTGIIMRFELQSEMSAEWCPALDNSDDFAITPDGEIWMGRDGKLFEYNHQKAVWQLLADFKEITGDFYRLAVSKNGKYLAMVTFKGKRP